jgi:hypothetical protein
VYDTSSDQRRTTALKQRNTAISMENDILRAEITDLKDIIAIICRSNDREPILDIVQALPQNDFENTADVATLVRDTHAAGLSESTARPIGLAGPSGFRATNSIYAPTPFTQPPMFGRPFRPGIYDDDVTPSPTTQSNWSPGVHEGDDVDQEESSTQWTPGRGFQDPNWPYGRP